jgi:hypothetical protein
MPEKCLELPASVHAILSGVDLIPHAGDVGELWLLDRLSELAPVVAVHNKRPFRGGNPGALALGGAPRALAGFSVRCVILYV